MFAGPTTRFLRALGSALLIAMLLLPTSVATAQKLKRERNTGRLSLQELRAELTTAMRRFRSLRDRAKSIQASMDKTELAVRGLAKKMLELEKSADSVARTLYKGGSSLGLQGLLGAESASDAEMRLKYLESSGQARTSVFERLASDREELEKKLDALDEARAEANAARNRIARLQDEIASKIELKKKELAAIDARLARQARAVAVQRVVVLSPAPVPSGPYSVNWDAIAMCESGGNWKLDSTYDGGLQFHPNTWLAYGGGRYARYAWQATREQQIGIAERVLAAQGPSAWPHCFKYGV